MWMRLVYLNIVFELTIGCSIGTLQATNVVVDTTFAGKHYVPQPGRQEWATSIECIAANGAKLLPFIIFKSENLLTTWILPTVGDGWKFSCNFRGCTSNYHGIRECNRSGCPTFPGSSRLRFHPVGQSRTKGSRFNLDSGSGTV